MISSWAFAIVVRREMGKSRFQVNFILRQCWISKQIPALMFAKLTNPTPTTDNFESESEREIERGEVFDEILLFYEVMEEFWGAVVMIYI